MLIIRFSICLLMISWHLSWSRRGIIIFRASFNHCQLIGWGFGLNFVENGLQMYLCWGGDQRRKICWHFLVRRKALLSGIWAQTIFCGFYILNLRSQTTSLPHYPAPWSLSLSSSRSVVFFFFQSVFAFFLSFSLFPSLWASVGDELLPRGEAWI